MRRRCDNPRSDGDLLVVLVYSLFLSSFRRREVRNLLLHRRIHDLSPG